MINYMALLGVHFQLVTVIGGSRRMAKGKDMEQPSGLMERDTRGNTSRIRSTGTEYTDGQKEMFIMEDTSRIRRMVMGITGFHLALNTTESSRIARYGEMESRKRTNNYLESNMLITNFSAKSNSMFHLQND